MYFIPVVNLATDRLTWVFFIAVSNSGDGASIRFSGKSRSLYVLHISHALLLKSTSSQLLTNYFRFRLLRCLIGLHQVNKTTPALMWWRMWVEEIYNIRFLCGSWIPSPTSHSKLLSDSPAGGVCHQIHQQRGTRERVSERGLSWCGAGSVTVANALCAIPGSPSKPQCLKYFTEHFVWV